MNNNGIIIGEMFGQITILLTDWGTALLIVFHYSAMSLCLCYSHSHPSPLSFPINMLVGYLSPTDLATNLCTSHYPLVI